MMRPASLLSLIVLSNAAACSLFVGPQPDVEPKSEGDGEEGEGEGEEGEGEAGEGEGEGEEGEGEGEGESGPPELLLTLPTFAVVGESVDAIENFSSVNVQPDSCALFVEAPDIGNRRQEVASTGVIIALGRNVVTAECLAADDGARTTATATITGWSIDTFAIAQTGRVTFTTDGALLDALDVSCDVTGRSLAVGIDTVTVQPTTLEPAAADPRITSSASATITLTCLSRANGATGTTTTADAELRVAPAVPTYTFAFEDSVLLWRVTSAAAGACELESASLATTFGTAQRTVAEPAPIDIVISQQDEGILTVPDLAVVCSDGFEGPTTQSNTIEQVFFGDVTQATQATLVDDGVTLVDEGVTVLVGNLDLDGEAGVETAYDFPDLVVVSGDLKLTDDTAVNGVYGVSFASLRIVGGTLELSSNADLGNLTIDGGAASANSFPNLEVIGGNLRLQNNANVSVARFPRLVRVGRAPDDVVQAPTASIVVVGSPLLPCNRILEFACNLEEPQPDKSLGNMCSCPN